jgi:hypothetical protein
MMLIVAVAWIYVVGLMALTETSVVAGIVTFLFYCVPLGTPGISPAAASAKRRRAPNCSAKPPPGLDSPPSFI